MEVIKNVFKLPAHSKKLKKMIKRTSFSGKSQCSERGSNNFSMINKFLKTIFLALLLVVSANTVKVNAQGIGGYPCPSSQCDNNVWCFLNTTGCDIELSWKNPCGDDAITFIVPAQDPAALDYPCHIYCFTPNCILYYGENFSDSNGTNFIELRTLYHKLWPNKSLNANFYF